MDCCFFPRNLDMPPWAAELIMGGGERLVVQLCITHMSRSLRIRRLLVICICNIDERRYNREGLILLDAGWSINIIRSSVVTASISRSYKEYRTPCMYFSNFTIMKWN